VGYEDGLNWYAYVRNDPINGIDPSGQDTFLVSRRVEVEVHNRGSTWQQNTGGRHMFVVTGVTNAGDPNGVRFSGGPSAGHDPALVPLQGTMTPTDLDDDAAWSAAGRGDPSINVVQIPTSVLPDDIVAGVGNAAIGNPDYDAGVIPGGNDGANSNSLARAIVDVSAGIAGVDPASIPNPAGWHPNIDQAGAVRFNQEGLDRLRK
jgi:uncharacterized protein RhaS with RHS repeats